MYNINNEGVGGHPFLTMHLSSKEANSFNQADIDDNFTALTISDSNEVEKGNSGERLFGKIIWVSEELRPGTNIPAICSVQARGVARFIYTGTSPVVNGSVVVNGDGRVIYAISVDIESIDNYVIAVNEENYTCDVWLG